ncbi:MAG TPA: hypothetical protein VLY03_02005 [Bacteroidota bacterium]|nr:hypothetical protein [Bacteroidota bacterium]
MKSFISIACAIFIAGYAVAGDSPQTATTPQFDRLKSLVGNWEGKTDDGKPVNVSYKLVSSGSALMETLNSYEHVDAMITMYHLNGTKLMMTHYCSAGNQPRMRAEKSSAGGNEIVFKFIDATNLASPKDMHMSKLVVRFKDKNHFTQVWTMSKDGKEAETSTFEYVRVVD